MAEARLVSTLTLRLPDIPEDLWPTRTGKPGSFQTKRRAHNGLLVMLVGIPSSVEGGEG